MPPILYKYKAYSSDALECILLNKIWLSKPEKFNDPFDCKPHMGTLRTQKQLARVLRVVNKMLPESSSRDHHITEGGAMEAFNLQLAGEMWNRNILDFGIYSLTETNRNLMMWAHYADMHEGFAIGYDTAAWQNSERVKLGRVRYVEDLRKYSYGDFLKSAERGLIIEEVAFEKSLDWSSENEWRLVVQGFSGRLVDSPLNPVEVIFGHRLSKNRRYALYQAFYHTNPDIHFRVAEPSGSKFELEIMDYRPDEYNESEMDAFLRKYKHMLDKL